MAQYERIGPEVIFAVASMFLIFMFLTTWFDQEPVLATKANFVLVMGILGIIGLFAWSIVGQRKLNITTNISGIRLVYAVVGGMLIVGASAGLWNQIQGKMVAAGSFAFLAGQSIDVTRAFLVLIAVAEEVFFCWGVLLGMMVLLSGRKLLFFEAVPFPGLLVALVAASLIFAIFHGAVYGVTDALGLMFIYRIFMGGSYILSGLIWGENSIAPAIIGHATVNFIASGGLG